MITSSFTERFPTADTAFIAVPTATAVLAVLEANLSTLLKNFLSVLQALNPSVTSRNPHEKPRS